MGALGQPNVWYSKIQNEYHIWLAHINVNTKNEEREHVISRNWEKWLTEGMWFTMQWMDGALKFLFSELRLSGEQVQY